jgi:hypothetical protein
MGDLWLILSDFLAGCYLATEARIVIPSFSISFVAGGW